jgi:hypothetical protein
MRTTINLPDRLLAQAKKAALESRTTLTELITNAVRESLARRRSKLPLEVPPMPIYSPPPGGGGLQPGVDLDDTAALLDLMEPPDAIATRDPATSDAVPMRDPLDSLRANSRR